MKKTGMGSHQSAKMKTDEWLTPPEIIKALGPFDLDPCSPVSRPWDTAEKHYTKKDNGLILPWEGRVWLNPPYGKESAKWLKKLSEHGNGIALIFARTETKMFFDYVWKKADAIFFLKKRLFFHHVNGQKAKGNAGAPSCFVVYGEENRNALLYLRMDGALVDDWRIT